MEKERQSSKQASGKDQGGQRAVRSGRQAPRKQVYHVRKPPTGNVQTAGRQSTVISVSWMGGVVVVLVLAALGWWLFSAASGANTRSGGAASSSRDFAGAAGETQAQLEKEAVVAQVVAGGKQSVDIVLNSATFQYEPKVVKVKQGIPVHFNLSVKNGDPG